MWLDGVPRPDHGPGFRQRLCPRCRATWVGHERDGPTWCPWCQTRQEALRARLRAELLEPAHLRTGRGNARYDALGPDDRAVWDRTRGQTRGTDTALWWVGRLARAVDDGWITDDEARTAIRKVRRWSPPTTK